MSLEESRDIALAVQERIDLLTNTLQTAIQGLERKNDEIQLLREKLDIVTDALYAIDIVLVKCYYHPLECDYWTTERRDSGESSYCSGCNVDICSDCLKTHGWTKLQGRTVLCPDCDT